MTKLRPAIPFEVLAPDAIRQPIVAHVPHASTRIPGSIRAGLLLDDDALEGELVRLTDWHTDALFSWTRALGASMFVNRLSRLVFDPERFVDDALEPMTRVGQGVVYTRTTDGHALQTISDEARAARIEALYTPYHAQLTALVAGALEDFGHCLLLDCHSFSSQPLPNEPDQAPDRPDICLGTDPVHSPLVLVERLHRAFEDEGFRVRVDSPFSGSLVPLAYYGRDDRVSSVMIEVRRGLYCDERTGELTSAFPATRARLQRAFASVISSRTAWRAR